MAQRAVPGLYAGIAQDDSEGFGHVGRTERLCDAKPEDLLRLPHRHLAPGQLPHDRVREMAQRAVPGLYAGIAAKDFDPAISRTRSWGSCPGVKRVGKPMSA
jgi:hypothetical protein